MTVSDLIQQLQQMDPNKEVWHNSSEGWMCEPLSSNPFYDKTAVGVGGKWITMTDAQDFKCIGSIVQSKDVVMLDGM